jgi:putative IMPACT (imprinted ancient) family translation regulator
MKPDPSILPSRPDINLHIERLVLDGVPLGSADVPLLQAAMEQELGRLLSSAPPQEWSGGDIAQCAARPVHLAAGGSARAWGRQVAASLFSSIRTDPGRDKQPIT